MIARAFGWSLAATALGMLAQLALMAALSRLLGPAEFGLMAASALATRFIAYFAQAGIGPALIQRPTLADGHHAAAVAASATIGLLAWLLFILLAAPLALFFRDAELRPVLMVTPAALLLASLASVPQSLLRRAMRFKALATADLASLALGYGGTSITLALLGFGVWSLVIGGIVQQATMLVLAGLAARPRWLSRPSRTHFRDLLGYGSRYSLVAFLDFLSSNVETLFVGRWLGTGELGTYNRVSSVTSLPADQAMSAVQRVAFPAMARVTSADTRFASALLLSLRLSCLVTIPLAAGMSLCAAGLVGTLLGPAWSAAVPVAAVLVWAIPAIYLSMFAGSAVDLAAEFGRKAVVIGVVLLVKLGLMLLVGSRGLVWVAGAMVLAEWMRAAGILGVASRRLSIRPLELLASLRGGVIAGLAVAVAVLAFDLGTRALGGQATPAGWPFVGQFFAALLAFALAAPRGLRPIVERGTAAGLDMAALRPFVRA